MIAEEKFDVIYRTATQGCPYSVISAVLLMSCYILLNCSCILNGNFSVAVNISRNKLFVWIYNPDRFTAYTENFLAIALVKKICRRLCRNVICIAVVPVQVVICIFQRFCDYVCNFFELFGANGLSVNRVAVYSVRSFIP